jgi:hypothetical protein
MAMISNFEKYLEFCHEKDKPIRETLTTAVSDVSSVVTEAP